jgi:hypothetical protein
MSKKPMVFPRDAWRVPHLISCPGAPADLPRGWGYDWFREQEARRKAANKQTLLDIERLIKMREQGVPGIHVNIPLADFRRMIDKYVYSGTLLWFKQLQREHNQILYP